MSGDLEQLAYETAVRVLEQQDRMVQELRARAAILLATSSLTVSLVGQASFDSGPSSSLALTALAVFATSIAAGVYVLIPRPSIAFSPSGAELYERLYDANAKQTDLHRLLTYELDRYRAKNDQIIAKLILGCQIAALALVAEVITLLTHTADTII